MPAKKSAAPNSNQSTQANRRPAQKPVVTLTAKKRATSGAARPKRLGSSRDEGLDFARLVCGHAYNKKAESIVILDVREISPITDFLVLCNGSSVPHLRAICHEVADRLREDKGIRPLAQDGSPESGWMIYHFGDVILHAFLEEKRRYYALEDCWSDAAQVAFQP